MVTDKTPAHKRIARAEKGREEWKMKAIERREEAEKLKLDLELNETRLSFYEQQNKELKDKLTAAESQIANQQKTLESLKKNSGK